MACARGGILPQLATDTPVPSLTPPGSTVAADPSPTLTATATLIPSATPTATLTPEPTATEIPAAELQLAAGAAARSYVVPLTVQHLSPERALLFFRLDGPAAGYVVYRSLPATSNTWMLRPLDASLAIHQIGLEGLQPDSRYEIQVALGESLGSLRAPQLEGQRWGPLSVRTPALVAETLRVGLIGDSGFGEETTELLIGRMALQKLDFVVHSGDLMYRSAEEDSLPQSYAHKFYLAFQPLLTYMPVYPVPGNHDLEAATRWNGEAFYYAAFPGFTDPAVQAPPGRGWYAFSYGSVQFVMLNSQVFHGEPGRADQLDWLAERMSDARFPVSIPVLHVPPYTSGRHVNDGRASRTDWQPLFEQAGVPLVISGHDHNYERLLFNQTTYLVSGGGSSVLYPLTQPLSSSQMFTDRSHFVVLEIGESRITLAAIDEHGEVFDRAVIEPSPP